MYKVTMKYPDQKEPRNYKGFVIWYDGNQIDYPWRIKDCAFRTIEEAKKSIDNCGF